jgi:hypothetical protein
MPIREVECCSNKRLILIQEIGFVYFGVGAEASDVVFDRLEANQDCIG